MRNNDDYTLPALRIAIVYAIFGGLWILLSDKFLGLLVTEQDAYTTAQTFKGWLYIALTALLIFYLVRRDLRALSRAHHDLALSEQRYRLATDAAGAGIWEVDLVNGDMLLNDHYLQALGYAPRTFPPIRASWEALIHPEDKQNVMDALNAHLRGEADEYVARYRLLAGNGRWQWVMDRGRVFLQDRRGTPLRAIGVQITLAETNGMAA